ncbi:hypothetical protein cypCar_00042410 [Cyprinus carpio]|nr:hypothetical protein cypCar_00042410 [Cyprinus carpio]
MNSYRLPDLLPVQRAERWLPQKSQRSGLRSRYGFRSVMMMISVSLKGLNTIRSPAGRSLLVSGWFGWVRHPNYSGDILMMFAWCLPCGFTSVLPYLPVLQCFNLLRQRANEIEESCLKKHRDAWREYCRRVPYKLLPYVY